MATLKGHSGGKENIVIPARRVQLSFADGFIAEHVADLWEPWMRHADQALNDDRLLEIMQTAWSKLCKKSKTRGRTGTPAEIILRLLLLKHIRDWSYAELEREVRANLVYREFTRIGGGKVPDNKSISRFGRQLGPEVVEQLHQRVVAIARENDVVQGRKLRVDTTVVETNIHYPTDSTLLNDGVRVLTRVMKKVTEVAGQAGTRLRDRTRSVKRRLLEIVRASRDRSEKGQQKLRDAYGRLLSSVTRVVGQAKKFSAEIASRIKWGNRDVLRKARRQLDEMIPRVQQVIRQTRQRIMGGDTRAEGKIVSLFEPQTEVIRKGKAGKPTEFGKLVKIQEAENQIITHYSVFDQRPSDSELLIPSLEQHQLLFGCMPVMATADAGFFSAANEAKAEEMGVKRVAVPSQSTKSTQRKQRQKQRWFKRAMRWRTGCEGRISVLKRRHGLNRSRYKGRDGMKRWVGLGVIADNLINLARAMTA
jgi:IS5 family transposase